MKIDEVIWYCKKLNKPDIDGNDYSKPIEIITALHNFTVMGKSGYSDIIEFGENINSYLTAIAQPYEKWVNEFHNGDLFYCNGAYPDEDEDYYGQNANYVVDNVDYGNLRIKLTLKKVAE